MYKYSFLIKKSAFVLAIIALMCCSVLFADFNGLGDPDSVLNTPSYNAVMDSVMQDALSYINVKPYELSFEKKYGGRDSFRLHAIDTMMDDPLFTAAYSDSISRIASNKEDRILPYIEFAVQSLCERHIDTLEAKKDTAFVMPDTLVLSREFIPNPDEYEKYRTVLEDAQFTGELLDKLTNFMCVSVEAGKMINTVMDTIPEDFRMSIIRDAAELWLDQEEDPDSTALMYLLYSFVPEKVDSVEEISTRDLLKWMDWLDYNTLYSSFYIYAKAWDELQIVMNDSLTEIPELVGTEQIEGIDGKVVLFYRTFDFELVIGGIEENIYRKDFQFIIDLGGDDIYKNRAGFAGGYVNYFTSWVIDIKGDDSYLCDENFFAQGSSVMGIGGLYDFEGDDIFKAGGYSQGSSIIGMSVLYNGNGNDIFSGGAHCQSAATFGISMLISGCPDGSNEYISRDDADTDYRAYRYSQSFASIKSFTLLRDIGGDDTYYAGGKFHHEPLHPQLYQSMSQGFGFGWRGAASGGVALLLDETGNDNYYTQIYGQGSSYWYAFGLLYDVTGHDTYQMGHYGQGAGIHLSVGALIDRMGEESYYGRRGPSQGCAHDWAVGLMIDGGGPDYYSADGIAWGQGHANGIGIFIDFSGPDVYGGKSSGHVQGTASPARGYGGLGLFLDLGGDDRYIKDQGENDRIWTKGYYGVGVDADIIEEGDM